jgi:hypothetical protein
LKLNILFMIVPVAAVSLITLKMTAHSPDQNIKTTNAAKKEVVVKNIATAVEKTKENLEIKVEKKLPETVTAESNSREVASTETQIDKPMTSANFKLDIPEIGDELRPGTFHERIGGLEAVKALGDELPRVARMNGLTAKQLRSNLIMDHTMSVTSAGEVVYIEDAMPNLKPEQTPVIAENEGPANLIASSETGLEAGIVVTTGTIAVSAASSSYDSFSLHSRPGAKKLIYLNFKGHTFVNSRYNICRYDAMAKVTICPTKIVSGAYDTDGDPTTFSVTELNNIKSIWQRVAGNYSPFDVDVTTELPTDDKLLKTSSTDEYFGAHILITQRDANFCTGCGGVQKGLFNALYNTSYTDKANIIAFCFEDQLANGYPKHVADCITHEIGHTYGLVHDGLLATAEEASSSWYKTYGLQYYYGHGSGETGWAPIMGTNYYKPVGQWSKGEYLGANNKVDEVAQIATLTPIIADDAGNTGYVATTKTYAQIKSMSGIIEKVGDIDVYKFPIATAGTYTIKVAPEISATMDLKVTLVNAANGALITAVNPTANLYGTITATLPVGNYYLKIESVAFGDPLTTGFSTYGGIGRYVVTMTP